MIRARTILVTLLASLSILFLNAAPALPAASDAGYNNSKILEFMNAERQARGVRSVSRDPDLDQRAQTWANKLAAEGRMYHAPCCAGMQAGYLSGAQNLAYHDDSLSAAAAHNLWMDSGIHRKNLLDPDFSHVGIAIACSTASGRAYVMAVVEFGGDGSPSSSTPARNPQVAGGSGNARAMSCDAGPAVTEPPTTVTAPPAPPTTGAPAATKAPGPGTTKAVAKATTKALAKPTTTSAAKPTTTTALRKATSTTAAATSTSAAPVAAAVVESTPPTTTPALLEPDLTAAQGSFGKDKSAFLIVGGAAVAAALLFAQSRFRRRSRPKHSAGWRG